MYTEKIKTLLDKRDELQAKLNIQDYQELIKTERYQMCVKALSGEEVSIGFFGNRFILTEKGILYILVDEKIKISAGNSDIANYFCKNFPKVEKKAYKKLQSEVNRLTNMLN